jgi:L-ascorbate metabolism protein UlaG (beta-lactamase superfamily)
MSQPERSAKDLCMRGIGRFLWIIVVAFAATVFGSPVRAQTPGPAPAQPASRPDVTQACPAFVAGSRPATLPASFDLAALNPDQVRITYVGHATFLIESAQGVRIATDYNDFVRPPVLPDIATMNHAHPTHYTDHPDPAIKYVLRGWGPSPDKPAVWDLQYRDVRVRNVPTNIRGAFGSTERYGNSIFIFEIANLCIVHLGHLHHTLTERQLNAIGRPDVVMAPVDGGLTLDLDGMMVVLTALKPSLIIPMHFFNQFTLERFLDRARGKWDIETAAVPTFVASKSTLPAKTKVLVLPGH